MSNQCKIHPVPATGTCHHCRAYTCDKCAKVGRVCPYCKMADIVPAEEARKAINQCVNHPGIRAAAACPDCEKIFCASCLNSFGQCMDCGVRFPRQKLTAAPSRQEIEAAEHRSHRKKKARRGMLGFTRAAIGVAVLVGVGALLNWQYQMLKAAVPAKGRPGTGPGGGIVANVKAYDKAVAAHGKDLNDIMDRIESENYTPEDVKAVDDLMARIESGEQNLNSMDAATRQKLQVAEAMIKHRPARGAAPAAREYQAADAGPAGPRRPYEGPPIRLRGGGGRTEYGGGAAAAARQAPRAAAPRPVRVNVSITNPAAGARLRGTAVVAARLVGDGVNRVEFQVNGQWQGLSNQPPYRFDWDTTGVRNGAVTLRVVAYDGLGRPHSSRPVRVTVQN